MEYLSLVSIILPTFNRAQILRRAIDSVIIQTYPNWELIVWNDGSADDTEEIVKSYADPRIRYYYEENHGVAYARNQAIAVSKGNYLAFLDSDDQWTDEKLFTQVKALDTHPQIEALFCDFSNINISTQEVTTTFAKYKTAMDLLRVSPLDDNLFLISDGFLRSLATENFIATDSMIVRRETMEKAGAFADGLGGMEDFEMWWRMGLAGVRFAYLNQVYLVRYKYPGSLSSPGIATYKNKLRTLELCLHTALSRGQSQAIPYLNGPFRNTWMNMIPLYGRMGDSGEMFKAFARSLRYGFTLGAVRLLIETLLYGNRKIKKQMNFLQET